MRVTVRPASVQGKPKDKFAAQTDLDDDDGRGRYDQREKGEGDEVERDRKLAQEEV